MIDIDHLLGLPPRITTHVYTERDTMLYALGVGAGQDATDADDLRFVYEQDLHALPTMAVVLAYPGFWQKEPAYGIDWKKVLHAEQSVEFHAPLPVEGEVRGEMTIEAIVDKGAGKGALLYAMRQIFAVPDVRLLATVRQTSFLRGDGSCGERTGQARRPDPHAIPNRAPDAELTLTTRPEQALLYRLSGDYNPLHADPQIAANAGLPRPVLHGLCTYGIAGRAVLKLACANDPARLKRLDCRFTAPVFPGDELSVALWHQDLGHVAFRASVPARGVTVLDHGYAQFDPT